MNILLVGGGSGGPVSPLLALKDCIANKYPETKFLLVGSHNGPEREMAHNVNLDFRSISSGKLKRYFSFSNFLAPFSVIRGFFESFGILNEFKPDCVVGTGSFVQVPLVIAAWIKKIPVLLHQQDVVASLANKLCQFFASKITLTFKVSINGFFSSFGIFYSHKNSEKFVVTGNPFRESLKLVDKNTALKNLNLNSKFPTIFIIGGGTGSEFINKLVLASLDTLTKYVQIIHSTGKNKMAFVKHENYYASEFIQDVGSAYAVADVVISRAGLSTITELSNLGKLSIIIPMPESHQEVNAFYLAKENSAIIIDQKHITAEAFVNLIRKLLFEHQASEYLKKNIFNIMPHDSTEKIAEIILKLAK